MPLYDFECLDCRKKYTALVSWQDKEKAACPQCGSTRKKERYEDYRLGSVGSNSGGGSCTPSFGGG